MSIVYWAGSTGDHTLKEDRCEMVCLELIIFHMVSKSDGGPYPFSLYLFLQFGSALGAFLLPQIAIGDGDHTPLAISSACLWHFSNKK